MPLWSDLKKEDEFYVKKLTLTRKFRDKTLIPPLSDSLQLFNRLRLLPANHSRVVVIESMGNFQLPCGCRAYVRRTFLASPMVFAKTCQM